MPAWLGLRHSYCFRERRVKATGRLVPAYIAEAWEAGRGGPGSAETQGMERLDVDAHACDPQQRLRQEDYLKVNQGYIARPTEVVGRRIHHKPYSPTVICHRNWRSTSSSGVSPTVAFSFNA